MNDSMLSPIRTKAAAAHRVDAVHLLLPHPMAFPQFLGGFESVSFLFCCNVIHSHWFLRFFHHHVYRCFGCSVREGYGMTETSCVISSMDEGDNLSGHVGSPNPACGKKHNV